MCRTCAQQRLILFKALPWAFSATMLLLISDLQFPDLLRAPLLYWCCCKAELSNAFNTSILFSTSCSAWMYCSLLVPLVFPWQYCWQVLNTSQMIEEGNKKWIELKSQAMSFLASETFFVLCLMRKFTYYPVSKWVAYSTFRILIAFQVVCIINTVYLHFLA